MCREQKKYQYVIIRLQNSCLITFLKKIQKQPVQNQRCRSSQWRCSVKKCVLENFANFTGKHLCWSLFSIKLHTVSLQVFKKETSTQALFCEVCETLKKSYFEEHLQMTASGGFYKKVVLKNFAIFTRQKQLVICVL